MGRLKSAMGGVALLALAGCAGTPAATPIATPLPTPETCDARRIQTQVREMLAGRVFETHYLTINDQLTLSVWLVDPEIEAAARGGLSAGNWQALETGMALSHRIVDEIPCVARVFENVNPMIVDGHYAAWYIDFLPAQAFLGLHDPTTADLVDAVADTGASPATGRRGMPRVPAPSPSGACAWPSARASLQPLLGPAQSNTAAYLIAGGGIVVGSHRADSPADVAVQIQVEIGPGEMRDDVLLARLGKLARELACVSPAIDQFEVFLVDPDGRMSIYARVPGMLIEPDAGPLPAAKVLLYHYPAAGEP